MKKFLQRILGKLGLYDSFDLEMSLSPQTLADKLAAKTDRYRPDLFDIFSFNKKEYKGFVTLNGFAIKKPMTSIVSFGHLAEAFGIFQKEGNRLVVHTDVYCIHHYATAFGFGLTALIFLTSALFAMIGGLLTSDMDGLYAGIILLVFAAFILGLPILIMKWSVLSLKADLEEELRWTAKYG